MPAAKPKFETEAELVAAVGAALDGAEPAASIEAAINPGAFRVISKEDPAAAASLLGRGAVDAIILDLENPDGVATRSIVEIRSFDPDCPLIVFSGLGPGAWEEEAYLLGAAHVIEKPVRARLLQSLLGRTLAD